MKFSEKIINARKVKALTQEDLAEAVGVSRQAVSKWETEEAKPDLDKLVAICNVLDLSMDYLCLDKQPEATVELPPAPVKRKVGRYLIAGICIGLAIALLVGGLAITLWGGNNRDEQTEPTHTIQPSITYPPDQNPSVIPDYTQMLAQLKIGDCKWTNVDSHVYHLSFIPSVQIPDMKVEIMVRNNTLGTTSPVDAFQSGTSYVIEFTTPQHGFAYEFVAVCSLGDVKVQLPLIRVVSENGSGYTVDELWKQ